jgi:hypothetical protein
VSGTIDLLYEILNILTGEDSHSFGSLKKVLRVNDMISYAIIIVMHVFRLSHYGKVCSGDFIQDD